MKTHRFEIIVSEAIGVVPSCVYMPEPARGLFVFAHGAGAGMDHDFMESMATALAQTGIGTLRYQFPYIHKGSRRPDRSPVLMETVRAAVDVAAEMAPGLPLFAGGKSMGGRMTSMAAAEGGLGRVQGLVFIGFPLHPAGKPDTRRAEHLAQTDLPMLFLQGDRDALADLSLLEPVCKKLGKGSTLHVITGADHGFKVLKRSGRTEQDVMHELSQVALRWCSQVSI